MLELSGIAWCMSTNMGAVSSDGEYRYGGDVGNTLCGEGVHATQVENGRLGYRISFDSCVFDRFSTEADAAV